VTGSTILGTRSRVSDALQTTTRTDGMASTGKKKTTMAKLARESRLRERRQEKQAKKQARKDAAAHPPGQPADRSPGGDVLGDPASDEA
jgi:hypothetical protein